MSSKKSNPKLCKDKNIKYVPPHPNLHKSPDNHRYTLCSQGRRGIKKNWKNKLILITANETQGLSVTAYISQYMEYTVGSIPGTANRF